VLDGELGVGRTAVWRAAVERAADRFRVLASRPSESDAELPFAALGDLLDGVPADGLPAPQRRALEIALLRVEGDPPPLRAVAVAVLGLLRSLSESGPVLIAVDDAQWLDPGSARVLNFVLRRAERLPVALLVTRQGPLPLDLPWDLQIQLEPLELDALARVLRTRVGDHLLRPELKDLHRLSGGNPLFAIEIARDGVDRLQLPALIPEAARDAVLAVSALAHPRLPALEPILGESIDAAVEAGVLEVEGDRIRLTHPVLGSVLYAQAPAEHRRELHGVLAGVADEPEERARHLALATEVPDAGVAAALVRAASTARDPHAAARLAEHAVRLTPPDQPEDARRRTIAAAEHHFHAGALAHARELLEPLAGSDALVRLAEVSFAERGWAAAVEPLDRALRDAGEDPRLGAEIERRLAWGHHMAGDLERAAAHARSAAALAEQLGDPALLAITLANRAFLDFVRGEGLARDVIDRAVELETGRIPALERPSWLLALMLAWTGELERARAMLEAFRAEADDAARPFVLNWLARIEARAGNLAAAERFAQDALEITLQTGQDAERAFVLSTCGSVAALLGHTEAARETLREGLALATRTGMKPAELECLAALGSLELSLGNAAEAHAALAAVRGFGEPAVLRSQGDEIEALIALGRRQEAEALLGELERHDGAWARVTALRCRGLLRVPGALEAALEGCDEPFERARTLLALGATQRRNKQKAAAGAALGQAQAIFEALPAPIWADRARAEAARLGGRPSERWALTETERRVAGLVATGRTNREVADALFVSVKTVEWNLSKVYRKLDVRSRTELAALVNAGDLPGS
jgi:DNA-binding CsgD family transcriptional regulator